MRVRTAALSLAIALAVSPVASSRCLLACLTGSELSQDAHRHHHVEVDTNSTALQAAPHDCAHGLGSELLAAAAATKAAKALTLPVLNGVIDDEVLRTVVMPWHGTPPGRAAPPGAAISLPLRI